MARADRTLVSAPPAPAALEPPAITSSLIDKHAPDNWAETVPLSRVQELIRDAVPIQMVVLCADIRRSTLLMKEATDPRHFAAEISGFVNDAKRGIQAHGGWFDKFTGDGFLAYWVCDGPDGWEALMPQVAGSCFTLIDAMDARLDRLRPSLQNLPHGTGLSCGVDIGPTALVTIADELTVLGPAVVGAVRMVSTASEPRETLVNVGLGSRLFREREAFGSRFGFDVHRELRATKEYASQEVYSLVPRANWKALLSDWADPNHGRAEPPRLRRAEDKSARRPVA
jgi:class 3 adenylate cyclase